MLLTTGQVIVIGPLPPRNLSLVPHFRRFACKAFYEFLPRFPNAILTGFTFQQTLTTQCTLLGKPYSNMQHSKPSCKDNCCQNYSIQPSIVWRNSIAVHVAQCICEH